MIERFEVEIPSLTGDKKRKAYVYLPYGYGKGNKRYPVIYMFDGHNLFSDKEATFGKCWGLSDYLDKTKTELIVAAVECNHEGNNRLSEYSPVDFHFKNGEKIVGKGKKYMDWLVKVFKPYIDENYLTLPERQNTAIGGSSMGGLMTLYALSKYNKYFSKGAALSPSLWACGGGVPEFIQNAKFSKDTQIYTDYGSREFVNHSEQKKAFSLTCSHLIERGVAVTARVVLGGTHSEASWEKQIPIFMNALGFAPHDNI
ncbi:MAG: alpha/beta hydrolase [Clostridia bacterium]|nr:alpha/beta hydrolase [Clostridia bacterium]